MNESADWTKDADVTAALYDLVESSVQDDIIESHRRLTRLYQLLIKYCSQQTLQSGYWFGAIFEQRQRLKDLTSNTNVRISFTDDVLDSCYNQALMICAVAESGSIKKKEFYKRPSKWTLDFLLDDNNIKKLLTAYAYTEEAQIFIDDVWNFPYKKGQEEKGE